MIIPTGYAQVNLIFSGADIPTGAQMTFGVDNTANDDLPEAIALAVETAFSGADIESLMNQQCTLSGILVKNGPNATGPSSLFTTAIAGAVAGDSDPPQTAVLIHKVTQMGGRAGRGRMYMPGVPEAYINGSGALTGTTALAYSTAWSLFRSGMEGAQLPLVLLHGEGSPITEPTPVVSLNADGQCATQRRRNRR